MLIIILAGGLPSVAETLHWNKGRGYQGFRFATADGVRITNTSDSVEYDYFQLKDKALSFNLDFRASNHGIWGFFLTADTDTVFLKISSGEKERMVEKDPCMVVEYFNAPKSVRLEKTVISGVNIYSGPNIWEVSLKDGILSVSAGNTSLHQIINEDFDKKVNGFGFYTAPKGELTVSDINLEINLNDERIREKDSEWIDNYFENSSDPMEGYWKLYDRDLEEDLLKPGGNYTLACVKEGETYEMLYVDGAVVNSEAWREGDVKLKLIPTPFEGVYEVAWIDAMKEPMSHDIIAQKEQEDMMVIQFPYQSSRLRLRRIPR